MARGGGGVGGAGGIAPDPLALAINLVSGVMLVADIIKQNTPTLENEVVVEVVGQPGATKQQLYFLALAAASSVVQQIAPLNPAVAFLSPSAGMLLIEYDAADNWVRCTLKYTSGMAANYAFTGGPLAAPGRTLFDRLAVMRGPACDLNGSPFGFIAQAGGPLGPLVLLAIPGIGPAIAGTIDALTLLGTAGIPSGSTLAAGAPQLPFAGNPILTACPTTPTPVPNAIVQVPVLDSPLNGAVGPTIPSPNPKPPGDNRSRGAVTVPNIGNPGIPFGTCCNQSLALIPLIFTALSTPATNAGMTFADPISGPGGS